MTNQAANKTKPNRGGNRAGAGRKPEDKIQVTFKLAPDVVEFLRNNRPCSKTIENAIRIYSKNTLNNN